MKKIISKGVLYAISEGYNHLKLNTCIQDCLAWCFNAWAFVVLPFWVTFCENYNNGVIDILWACYFYAAGL